MVNAKEEEETMKTKVNNDSARDRLDVLTDSTSSPVILIESIKVEKYDVI